MKNKTIKICSISFLLIGISLFLGLQWLSNQSYPVQEEAAPLIRVNQAKIEDDYVYFAAKEKGPTLLLTPGAFVPAEAYAAIGAGLAEKGINTYIIQSPYNLPILDGKAIDKLIQQKKIDTNTLYLAGHSMGGVMAARGAKKLSQDGKTPAGLIFLASYPDQETDLAKSNLPVLSITASQDLVLNWQNYYTAKSRLPEATSYFQIQGGNHSGFALYGPQKHDGIATISKNQQAQEIVNQINNFINR